MLTELLKQYDRDKGGNFLRIAHEDVKHIERAMRAYNDVTIHAPIIRTEVKRPQDLVIEYSKLYTQTDMDRIRAKVDTLIATVFKTIADNQSETNTIAMGRELSCALSAFNKSMRDEK